MKIIGIQGAQGSFSELAAQDFISRNQIESFKIEYLISSDQVLAAIDANRIDFGIFAMENAQGGVVIESVYALAKYRCNIIEMFHIFISQNLFTLPSIKLNDITSIHSHQQALRQCKNFLADHFWGRPLIEEDDTAEAARRLANGTLEKTAAVIANKACAKLYQLHLQQADIHDLKNNLTLFLAVQPI